MAKALLVRLLELSEEHWKAVEPNRQCMQKEARVVLVANLALRLLLGSSQFKQTVTDHTERDKVAGLLAKLDTWEFTTRNPARPHFQVLALVLKNVQYTAAGHTNPLQKYPRLSKADSMLCAPPATPFEAMVTEPRKKEAQKPTQRKRAHVGGEEPPAKKGRVEEATVKEAKKPKRAQAPRGKRHPLNRAKKLLVEVPKKEVEVPKKEVGNFGYLKVRTLSTDTTGGDVYLARDGSGGDVVLKELKAIDDREPGVLALLGSPGHRNVIKLLTSFRPHGDAKPQTLVLPFCSGGNLRDQILNGLDARRQKVLGLQLFDAMKYVHGKHIIHRDLKPENIFMTTPAGAADPHLVVGDFGLARPRAGVKTRGMVTLYYRAPEVLLGWAVYGAAVDLWSIGCILAEMHTRSPIFAATDETATVKAIVRKIGRPMKGGRFDKPVRTLIGPGSQGPSTKPVCGGPWAETVRGLLRWEPSERRA